MKDPKASTSNGTGVAYDSGQAQARVLEAWAELVEAAKTDPKARAFLDNFGKGGPNELGEAGS